MELLISFGGLGVVVLLAAMSPGPDFLVVSKNSISHSRAAGLYTAFGVGVASCIHITYTVMGLGFLIAKSIVLFSTIKFIGAAYLVYLGVALMTETHEAQSQPLEIGHKSNKDAFREGLFSSLLNPKATVFFVSIFSQFVSPSLPLAVRISMGAESAGIIAAWFLLLASVLTYPRVRNVIAVVQARVLKFMGAALLLLGVRLANSQS